MRQHTEGTVGNITWVLSEIYLAFQGQTRRHEFGVLLFWDTVYIQCEIKTFLVAYFLTILSKSLCHEIFFCVRVKFYTRCVAVIVQLSICRETHCL